MASSSRDIATTVIAPMVLLIVALTWAWVARPSLFYTLYTQVSARWHGMSNERIDVAGHQVRAFVGKGRESILLIHEFTSSKESWLPLATRLSDRYRVIAPDLPGIGASSRSTQHDYDIPSQANRMIGLIDMVDSGPVHLVGIGLGAEIAAAIAAQSPQRVISVTLVAPTGFTTPTPSAYDQFEGGVDPLVISSIDELKVTRETFLFQNPPELSRPALHHKGDLNIRFRRFNQKVLAEARNGDNHIISTLPKINAPTQILWCEEDQYRDISGLTTLAALKPNASAERLKNCGHMLPIAQPKRAADLINSFILNPSQAPAATR